MSAAHSKRNTLRRHIERDSNLNERSLVYAKSVKLKFLQSRTVAKHCLQLEIVHTTIRERHLVDPLLTKPVG